MNKSSLSHAPRRAFTLVEMLVVIAIIGILASILLPVLAKAKVKAAIAKAKTEISQMEGAILAYETEYGRLPSSPNATIGAPDFTFGTINTWNSPPAPPPPYAAIDQPGPYQANNSELVGILMAATTFTDGSPTVNTNHIRNPKKIEFLNGTIRKGNATNFVGVPGIGWDGVYRDPWGNPYLITIDSDYDGKCKDVFYRLQAVSQDTTASNGRTGHNGLFNADDNNGGGNNFALQRKVMVWSFGPDKKADSGAQANAGANADNILSWGK